MTCKCGSNRFMSLFMKHNDLTDLSIDHLGVNTHSGYFPYIGILGGDSTDFSVCMDCGTIKDWKPITDEDVRDDEKLSRLVKEEQ